MATPEKMKAALLLDDRRIAKWQEDALSEVQDLVEVCLIISCSNTTPRGSALRHGAYQALHAVSVRSPLTREHPVDAPIRQIIDFESVHEGASQRIPDETITRLRESGCRLILAFGVPRLAVTNLTGIDVISFRCGGSRRDQEFPVGFYELLQGAESVGTMVTKLSDTPDNENVLVSGYTKVYKHSYGKTVHDLYQGSPALLRRALINLRDGLEIDVKSNTKHNRLPGNGLVLKFCMHLWIRKLQRLAYGAFYEKRWNIIVFDDFDVERSRNLVAARGKIAPIAPRYNFYADPFFSADGSKIRAEALVGSTGRGEIVELHAESMEIERTLLAGGHCSYPYTFEDAGREFMLPEVAGHEAPYLLEIADSPRKIRLAGLENLRLVDPSLVKVDGRYYLFGGDAGSAAGMLQLFVADAVTGPYRPHRMNPVVIDPVRARMGGRLVTLDGKLYRFGQDNSDSYGNGIRVMEVLRIDPDLYEEREIGRMRFSDASGPHTVDIRNGRAVLDFYMDRFSFLAGYRRFAARIHAWLIGKGA